MINPKFLCFKNSFSTLKSWKCCYNIFSNSLIYFSHSSSEWNPFGTEFLLLLVCFKMGERDILFSHVDIQLKIICWKEFCSSKESRLSFVFIYIYLFLYFYFSLTYLFSFNSFFPSITLLIYLNYFNLLFIFNLISGSVIPPFLFIFSRLFWLCLMLHFF